MNIIRSLFLMSAIIALPDARDEYIGDYSANKNYANATFNLNRAWSPCSANSANGKYGSPNSATSASNLYATDAPKLYDVDGNYRSKLSSKPYPTDTTSNSYGRYGSSYSSESINKPYGAQRRQRRVASVGTCMYPEKVKHIYT